MTFAIIKTGGKQYRVAVGTKLQVEKLDAVSGGTIVFDEVLLVSDGIETKIGTPHVPGVRVEAKVLREGRAKKVIVFKYHSKTRYKKKKGHRQPFTDIEVIAIK